MKLTVCAAVPVLAAVLTGFFPCAAIAQTFPSKPVRLLVAYSPGGAQDIVSRLLAAKLSEGLGQQVIVDNRPGGGATIATDMVARSAPDGYTLINTNIAHAANPAFISKLPYDTSRDFAPVSLLALFPLILVTHPSLPTKSITDLVAMAKAKPGQLNFASSGIGGAGHLAMALFVDATGIDAAHILYKGGGQAMTDVMTGQAHMMFIPIPPALPHVKAGKLRILVVSGVQRTPILPDTPTFAQSGIPGIEFYEWQAVIGRAGTPRDIIVKLNTEINKVLALPDVRERISGWGGEIQGGTPERLGEHIKTELARWSTVLKKSAGAVER